MFALFDYQEELSELVQNALRSKEYPTFLVQLPTGAGKTRTALDGIIQSIVTGHIQSVLWLAHSVELCVQACDSFENTWKHTGDRDFQLVRLWGSLKLKSDDFLDSFVVGSFSKVTNIFKAKSDDWARLVKDVDLIVIDEAHKAQAPTIQELLSCFKENDVKIMGLTATPGRGASSLSENLDLVHTFKHLFDSKLLGDDPITTLQERGILSRTKHEFVEINTSNVKPGSLQDEYDFSNRLLKQLASDENRNQQIVDLVARKVGEGKPTIVFACSVEHAKHLALLCAKKGLLSSSVHFKMRSAHRSKIIKSFTSGDIAVITNFGVLSTGFDAPKTGCVVITRPTTSIVLYSQMVGRGLRGPLMGGTETCEVVDVRDNAVAFGDLDEVYNYFKHYWTD
ncbi:MAG: DEAD/DEAH box helicase family protein [Bacteroidetes Order II. Incertae sedis bacterium]|nr:DEAD/DEAH box helicase family protein [Bacteroidetes Order II. bacterium]